MGIREIRLIGPNELSVIVDEEDYRTLKLGFYKWYPIIGRTTTYAMSKKNRKTIYLHRLILGLENAPRSVFVDHRDHNGLNNSRTNLRVTDNRGNQRNSRKSLSAKTFSSYKGVSCKPYKKLKKWLANITLPDVSRGGKKKYLGYYRTEVEAARAYNEAAKQLFGPMAFLNELPDQ
jgi:hypothetical protein